MKVFRFYPWEGISQISLAQGEAITFITMFGVPCILHRHHTGVEYCLFVQGFARASSQIDEYAPHFLCLPAARSIGQKKNPIYGKAGLSNSKSGGNCNCG